MIMIRKDYRSLPVRRLVVMGESNAYGMCASSARHEWVQVLADHIRESQDEPLRVFNNAIPANVISPDAPGYASGDIYGTAPSAIERFEEDMIAYSPDLAVYAYGLNDSRCGHNLQSFINAYQTIITRTRQALPGTLLVLVGPYWNIQYDQDLWEARYKTRWQAVYGLFDRPGDGLVLAYNQAIAELARTSGALFVDVYSLLEGSPWLMNADACHFNDLGQRLIGMAIFSMLAARCSFLAKKSKAIEESLNLSVSNTGGTDALPHVIHSARKVAGWKK
jgi:lysophospholipase L1-like esterase